MRMDPHLNFLFTWDKPMVKELTTCTHYQKFPGNFPVIQFAVLKCADPPVAGPRPVRASIETASPSGRKTVRTYGCQQVFVGVVV